MPKWAVREGAPVLVLVLVPAVVLSSVPVDDVEGRRYDIPLIRLDTKPEDSEEDSSNLTHLTSVLFPLS